MDVALLSIGQKKKKKKKLPEWTEEYPIFPPPCLGSCPLMVFTIFVTAQAVEDYDVIKNCFIICIFHFSI